MERLYPWIQWRVPVTVHRTDGTSRIACRLCIGRYGLQGKDIDRLFETEEQFETHMLLVHPGPE